MRILFVIDSLGSGGAQRQMVTLARGIASRGHLCEFFVYHPELDHFEPELTEAGIQIHKWRKSSRADLRVIAALRAKASRGAYEVIISFLDAPNLYSEMARLGLRAKLVVSERNSYAAHGPSFQKALLEQGYRLADKVVVNSHFQAGQMLQRLPWLSGRLSVIYNGTDQTLFQPSSIAVPTAHSLLAVGSVTPTKNALGLAHALLEYSKSFGLGPSVHWAGAVQHSRESEEEYRQVNHFLEQVGLRDRWTWLGERRDLDRLYPAYQALVHPSYREGLPNAVCEAMSAGLPVLLGAVGEHPRLVTPGETGFLFDPASPASIAEAIHSLRCVDEARRREMGQKARAFAESHFSLDSFVSRYEDLMHALLKSD